MAALSVLRSISNLCRFQQRHLLAGANQSRWMATHKRIMIVRPSKFQWHKFKDALHYYFLLGIIPLATLVFLVNIFVGPAELAEIPEGYQPEHWEYYKHPIERWFARYIYASHQQDYEKLLFKYKEEYEKRDLRFLQWKIHELMGERGDYQAWYYRPVTAKYLRQYRQQTREVEDAHGEF